MSERSEPDAEERYRILLEELRTIIPGAEVLLGFLLTAPFSNRFDELDRLGTWLAMVALLAAALATILFLAPSAYHRVARHGDRGERVRFGVRSQVGGLVLTAIAVCVSVFVVLRFLFGPAPGVVALVALVGTVLFSWVLLPLRAEMRDGSARPRSSRR